MNCNHNIVEVSFAESIPGGVWIKRSIGDNSFEIYWTTLEDLAFEIGYPETSRLFFVACGHGVGEWHTTNGRPRPKLEIQTVAD